jgi:hypothetical protein
VRYARQSDEHKYNFNMRVLAPDMRRHNHSLRQKDVVFRGALIILEYDDGSLSFVSRDMRWL